MKLAHQIAVASAVFAPIYMMALVSVPVSNQLEDLTQSGPVSEWPEGRAWPAKHELKSFFVSRQAELLLPEQFLMHYRLTQFSTFIPCVEDTWIFAQPGCEWIFARPGCEWSLQDLFKIYRGDCWESDFSYMPPSQDVSGPPISCYIEQFRGLLFDIFWSAVYDHLLLIVLECTRMLVVDQVLPEEGPLSTALRCFWIFLLWIFFFFSPLPVIQPWKRNVLYIFPDYHNILCAWWLFFTNCFVYQIKLFATKIHEQLLPMLRAWCNISWCERRYDALHNTFYPPRRDVSEARPADASS
jgi:hypothetical protein